MILGIGFNYMKCKKTKFLSIALLFLSSLQAQISPSPPGTNVKEYTEDPSGDDGPVTYVEGDLVVTESTTENDQSFDTVLHGNLHVDGDSQVSGLKIRNLGRNASSSPKWYKVGRIQNNQNSDPNHSSNQAQISGSLFAQTNSAFGSDQYIAHFSFNVRNNDVPGTIEPILVEYGDALEASSSTARVIWKIFKDSDGYHYLWVQQSRWSNFMQFVYSSYQVEEEWIDDSVEPLPTPGNNGWELVWSSEDGARQNAFKLGSVEGKGNVVAFQAMTVNGLLSADGGLSVENGLDVAGGLTTSALSINGNLNLKGANETSVDFGANELVLAIETVDSHLRNLNVDALPDRFVVNTLGYYSSGDGGGGQFILNKGGNGPDLDDGGSILNAFNTSASNWYWERIINTPFVTPEMFGAKGNATVFQLEGLQGESMANAFDDTLSINQAIRYAQNQGLELHFLKKIYRITDSIIVSNLPLAIKGAGSGLHFTSQSELSAAPSGTIIARHVTNGENYFVAFQIRGRYLEDWLGLEGVASWEQSTVYELGDKVQFELEAYECITPHTSGSTFSATGNWQALKVWDPQVSGNYANMSFGGRINGLHITDANLNPKPQDRTQIQPALELINLSKWKIFDLRISGVAGEGLVGKKIDDCYIYQIHISGCGFGFTEPDNHFAFHLHRTKNGFWRNTNTLDFYDSVLEANYIPDLGLGPDATEIHDSATLYIRNVYCKLDNVGAKRTKGIVINRVVGGAITVSPSFRGTGLPSASTLEAAIDIRDVRNLEYLGASFFIRDLSNVAQVENLISIDGCENSTLRLGADLSDDGAGPILLNTTMRFNDVINSRVEAKSVINENLLTTPHPDFSAFTITNCNQVDFQLEDIIGDVPSGINYTPTQLLGEDNTGVSVNALITGKISPDNGSSDGLEMSDQSVSLASGGAKRLIVDATGGVSVGDIENNNPADLVVTGEATVNDGLNVTGDATVSEQLTVTGDVDISGELNVANNSTLTKNLNVLGNINGLSIRNLGSNPSANERWFKVGRIQNDLASDPNANSNQAQFSGTLYAQTHSGFGSHQYIANFSFGTRNEDNDGIRPLLIEFGDALEKPADFRPIWRIYEKDSFHYLWVQQGKWSYFMQFLYSSYQVDESWVDESVEALPENGQNGWTLVWSSETGPRQDASHLGAIRSKNDLVTIENNLKVNGTITSIAPGGDIDMGDFGTN